MIARRFFDPVTLSGDGRTVEFGDLGNSSSDSEVTQLVGGRFSIRWLYLSVDNDRKWYIVTRSNGQVLEVVESGHQPVAAKDDPSNQKSAIHNALLLSPGLYRLFKIPRFRLFAR
jgi:hypothetical protein